MSVSDVRTILTNIDPTFRQDSELIDKTMEILMIVKRQLKDSRLLVLCVDWARVYLGRCLPSREQLQKSSQFSAKHYLTWMKKIQAALKNSNFNDVLTIEQVGKVLALTDWIPSVSRLVLDYESQAGISRSEQPHIIFAAFELLLRKKKKVTNVQDIFCLEAVPFKSVVSRMKTCCSKLVESLSKNLECFTQSIRERPTLSTDVEVVVEVAMSKPSSSLAIDSLISLVPFYEDPIYMACIKSST